MSRPGSHWHIKCRYPLKLVFEKESILGHGFHCYITSCLPTMQFKFVTIVSILDTQFALYICKPTCTYTFPSNEARANSVINV